MALADRPPPLHLVIEVARQAALTSYGVVDRPEAAGTDGVVRAALAYSGRPIAALALVAGELVHFAPMLGLELRRTPRRGSVWGSAIADPNPMAVCDLLDDCRFHDHPVTQGAAGLRFYAGAPLRDSDGYLLGSLCVLDTVPGQADAPLLDHLAVLADQAAACLEAHRDAAPPAAPLPLPAPLAEPAEVADITVQAWLGVRTKRASHPLDPNQPGLLVLSVAADSPAHRAAVRPTDVLVSIDGQVLRRSSDVPALLANRRPGGTVLLRLLRSGHMLDRTLPLEPAPALVRPEL